MENISGNVKEEKVFGNSQRNLPKGKTCLTNLIVPEDHMAGPVDERKGIDIIYKAKFWTRSATILLYPNWDIVVCMGR